MGKIAYYLRLSVEDGDKEESNSIGNQRKQILEYINQDSELCKLEIKEFCDDGYSGTNMDRPGMQKMLKEIKNNQIDCIIVKDMSRFARDYIEMGTYLNQVFPFMKIRFIAINDHYDSKKHQESTIDLDTAFGTLLYDLYSKDVSIKVKTSFESKCANGEYVFGQVPFGYEKSKEIKNQVVVNEKEAQVVRYIFSLALQGKSSTQIVKQLYEEKIPTITEIRKPETKKEDGKIHTWTVSSVRKLLNNRFYLGDMVYGKTVRKAVGSNKYNMVPQKEWKIIPQHHEALISPETFQQVSSFRSGYSTKRKREKHPLTGKVYCGGCKYSMNYKPISENNKYRRFECRKHTLFQIPECCTYMSAGVLEEIVLFMLKWEFMLCGNAMKEKGILVLYLKERIHKLEQKLYDYRKQKRLAQSEKDEAYEKYALGDISVEIYRKKTQQFTEQIFFLSTKEEKTEKELIQLKEGYQKIQEDMKILIHYLHIEELTQEVVDTFVKKVYLYKGKKVEVEWNFDMAMILK